MFDKAKQHEPGARLRFGTALMTWAAVAATLALSIPEAHAADAATPQTVPPSASPTASGAATRAGKDDGRTSATDTIAMQRQLQVGDRLQISFFEQLNLGQPVDVGLNGDVRTFYQRLDLTGEHTVDADGSIAIPLIGRFVLTGMTADEAQSKIMEAYQQATGRTGEVHIAVLERLPVFVTGIVKSPGAYPFRPGMILIQAIALAGGVNADAQDTARFTEAQHERERHAQAVDRLERLMARRLRLIKEGSLLDTPPTSVASDQQSEAAPVDELSDAVDSETRLLDAEMSARSDELGQQDVRIVTLKNTLDGLKSMSQLIDRQIEVRAERVRVLQAMQGRGLGSIENLWNAQKDVADFELQRERLNVEIHAAEQNIADAEAVRSKSTVDRKVAVQTQLVAVEDEIKQQENVVSTSEEITSALETDSMDVARGASKFQLIVLRRTGSATSPLPADETTSLMPGDVVKVEVVRSDQTAQVTTDGTY
jgi:protein involved in polysaccharide export with SLBB domain